jgi:hypothetical protein
MKLHEIDRTWSGESILPCTANTYSKTVEQYPIGNDVIFDVKIVVIRVNNKYSSQNNTNNEMRL